MAPTPLPDDADLFGDAHFRVNVGTVDGKTIGTFRECSGLEMEWDVVEYVEGGENRFVHKFRGRAKYQNLILKRGITAQATFLDWLTDRGIRWRVYRNGLSFFTLMPQYLDEIATGNGFRSVSKLADDWRTEADATFPQVVVIEPSYIDSPVDLEEPPNDNHPELPIAPGVQAAV